MENDKKIVRKLQTQIGQSGTTIYRGIVTAEDYNSKMVGLQGLKNMDIMRRSDSTVRSTLQVVKLPVKQASWYIEPASDEQEDIDRADFVNNQLFGSGLWDVGLNSSLTYLDFGHCVLEKTYGPITYNGKLMIGLTDLGYRKQTTIRAWEMKDGMPGITQKTTTIDVDIPRDKLMYFVHDQEGENYNGISLLRYCYRDWDIKDRLILINSIALEKGSIGVPVFEVPADASEADKAAADDYARQFRGNEEGYLRVPKGWKAEMLDLKANTTKDVLPSIKYHDRQIQLSVLAQFLAIGTTDSGSRSTSEDHTKLFLMSEEALAKYIQSVFQNELIKQLCDLNFTNMKNGYPQLKFGKIGDENMTETSTFINNVFNAGAMKYDPEIENHLRKIARLPEIPKDVLNKARKQWAENILNPPQPTEKPIVDKKDINASLDESRRIRSQLIDIVR